jgi:hypothetical protein
MLSVLAVIPDPAETFRCDAEIGSDMFQREPLFKMRIPLQESMVPRFGCHGQGLTDAVTHGDVSILQQDAVEAVELRDLIIQFFEALPFYQQEGGVFQRFHRVFGRLSTEETVHIACPPVFERKHQRMFHSFIVYIILTKTTFRNKTFVSHHISRLKQVLSFAELANFDGCSENVDLFRTEPDEPGEVLKNAFVHGLKLQELLPLKLTLTRCLPF